MQFLDAAAAWLMKGFGLSIATDCLLPEIVETPALAPPLRQKPVLRLIVNPSPVISVSPGTRREDRARSA